MKRMKRIMALMLAAIMMMAMSVTAFAAEGATGTHTLTVNVKSTTPAQDLKGQTINLYKLFDVTESGTTESKNYAYTVNTETGYKDAIKSALGTSFTGTTDEEYAAAVLALKDTEGAVQKFANDFTAEALTKKLSATANSGKIIEENKTSYTFENLAAGYYLVYVTGGKEIQSSLVTVDETTTTVNLKTEAPSITKTADKETAEIGQVVKYTVTGAIPDTTGYSEYVYKIHDELTKGLDFVNDANGTACEANSVKVTVAFTDTSLTVGGTTPTTATLDTANNRKMSLDLSAWVRDNQANKGKEFTVTYYAKVNKDAEVTNNNKASLEYGNNPDDTTTTTPSEADAKNGENAIKVSGSNGNYVVDPASTTTEFESVKSIDGKGYNLHINGLEAKDYWLVETQAPEGFNKLTDPIKVTITKDGDANWTVKKNDVSEDDKIIDVVNSTGSLLPSTGGRGAIAFAVIAALLVFGVAVSFIRDKRKEA